MKFHLNNHLLARAYRRVTCCLAPTTATLRNSVFTLGDSVLQTQRKIAWRISGLLTLLFVLLPCTCVRAQLRPDAPVTTYLADQFSEMGMADDLINGDFGPTRQAYTRQLQLWESGYIGAGWTGYSSQHTGTGSFTPHGRMTDYKSRLGQFYFGGGADQLAIFAQLQPLKAYNRLSLSASHFSDDHFVDKNEDGRNDGTTRNSTLVKLDGNWSKRQYSGSADLRYLRDNTERRSIFGNEQERIDFRTDHSLKLNNVSFFAKLKYIDERADRSFTSRQLNARRQTTSVAIGMSDYESLDRITYGINLSGLDRRDELTGPGLTYRQPERLYTFTTHFRYDVYPFRLYFNQQLLNSEIDGTRWRPNLRAIWFFANESMYATALFNRGGGFRNPLLSDAHLGYSLRNYELTDLQSEDFWRSGLLYQAKPMGYNRLVVDLQAIYFDYRRFTSVRYADEGRMSIRQGSANRRLLVAEVRYRPEFVRLGAAHPTLYFNYRYDDLRLADPDGALLPARQAAWLRLNVPYRKYNSRDAWRYNLEVSYMIQSAVEGLEEELVPDTGRSRLDFSLRVDFRQYWVALRGEQLLRNEPLTAYGFDPLGGEGEIPLADEFSTLTGRRFTLAAGIAIKRK